MSGTGEQASLRALQAQRLLDDAVMRFAPAAAAGLIAAAHAGAGNGVLLGAAMLLCASLLTLARHPLHLTPLAAVIVRALVPLAGAAVVLALPTGHGPVTVPDLVPAVAGAWVVGALVAWIRVRVETGLQARVAVIGPFDLAASLTRELKLTGSRAFRVVGHIGDAPGSLGSLDDLARIVAEENIDLLVNAGQEPNTIARVADACLAMNVRLIGANQFFEEQFGHVPIATLDSAFFQYLIHPRYHAGSRWARRALDVAVSGVGLVLAAPLIALAALAIRLFDGSPVLFRQVRVGQGGRQFRIAKLRTMRPDAEADGPRWSAPDDERITPVGRILRRTHVDELPQLWNVLRGEMSLVGPRPELPELVTDLEWRIPFYDRRALVRPGLTGWAQVRCGYAGTGHGTAWKLCHDLYYLKHRSLALDLLIMLETVSAVLGFSRVGARAPDERFVLDAVRGEPDGLAFRA